MKNSPATDVHVLDNPIWSALSTEQAYLAQANRLARRFPGDVAPFGAMAGQSVAEYHALAEILAGDAAALFLDAPPNLAAGWSMRPPAERCIRWSSRLRLPSRRLFRKLTVADVPEMLALTRLTQPVPFLPRTIELGSYFGIHESGTLVAMAGERLHLTGFTEVSAVCTHPDFRGRGYSSALMSAVISRIMRRGETPFLHAKTDNPAVRLVPEAGLQSVRAAQLPPGGDQVRSVMIKSRPCVVTKSNLVLLVRLVRTFFYQAQSPASARR